MRLFAVVFLCLAVTVTADAGRVARAHQLTSGPIGVWVPPRGDSGRPSVFQIDGQFYSGPVADDWAQGPSFAGVVLDDGIPDPAHRPTLCERDEDCAGGSSDCSMFVGAAKNNDDISPGAEPWSYGCVSSTPQKNDLTDVYAHARVVETGGSDEVWLVLGAATRALYGDSHIDFEWNVAGLEQVGTSSGQIIGHGPHAGRTADVDFIASVDLTGGGAVAAVAFRRWTYVGLEYDYALFTPAPDRAFVCADEVGAVAPPWGAIAPDGTEILPPGTLTPLQFVEVAVELTSIGLDPAVFEAEEATLMFKTRSSASFLAQLKDFALYPFSFADAVAGAPPARPPELVLHPPFPNPARPGTTLRFETPDDGGSVRLTVYSVDGRLVKEVLDGPVPTCCSEAHWDGTNARGQAAATGVYFVRLTSGGRSAARTIVLIR